MDIETAKNMTAHINITENTKYQNFSTKSMCIILA